MLKEQIKVLVLLLIYVFMAYNAFASFYKIGYFHSSSSSSGVKSSVRVDKKLCDKYKNIDNKKKCINICDASMKEADGVCKNYADRVSDAMSWNQHLVSRFKANLDSCHTIVIAKFLQSAGY